MTNRFPNHLRTKVLLSITAITTLATLAVTSTPAEAGLFDSRVAFAVSEKITPFVTSEPVDMKNAAWDSPSLRRLERNMPWIEVSNTSSAGDGSLTEFHLTIGDERFNFSNTNFANFISISPLSDVTNFDSTVIANGNELVLDFSNTPLAPGQRVLFRIDIDVDPTETEILNEWSYPDFRTVLFDMNGIDAYPDPNQPPNPLDNALAFGVVALGNNSIETTRSRLPDAPVANPQGQIYNQFTRQAKIMEPIDVFPGDVLVPVPEPSTSLMALFAMVGLGLVFQRRSSERRQFAATPASYRQRSVPRPQRETACRHRRASRATR